MYHKLKELLDKFHPVIIWIALILALYWLITIYNYRTGYELGYEVGKLANQSCQFDSFIIGK